MFPENIGSHISIDEISLSQGELYTIVTNKSGKGRKSSLIAMVKGTDVETVCAVLMRLSRCIRWRVREVTLDMASNMEKIIHHCFPPVKLVIDRFHVQKLAYEAVQEMRIKHRWEAIDSESNALGFIQNKG